MAASFVGRFTTTVKGVHLTSHRVQVVRGRSGMAPRAGTGASAELWAANTAEPWEDARRRLNDLVSCHASEELRELDTCATQHAVVFDEPTAFADERPAACFFACTAHTCTAQMSTLHMHIFLDGCQQLPCAPTAAPPLSYTTLTLPTHHTLSSTQKAQTFQLKQHLIQVNTHNIISKQNERDIIYTNKPLHTQYTG